MELFFAMIHSESLELYGALIHLAALALSAGLVRSSGLKPFSFMTRFTTDDSLDLDGSLHFDVTISTYGSFRLLGTLRGD